MGNAPRGLTLRFTVDASRWPFDVEQHNILLQGLAEAQNVMVLSSLKNGYNKYINKHILKKTAGALTPYGPYNSRFSSRESANKEIIHPH